MFAAQHTSTPQPPSPPSSDLPDEVRTPSPLWPLPRFLGRNGFDESALVPAKQLERLPGLHRWRSSGTNPQFLVRCCLPAGWIRIRYTIESSISTHLSIHVDEGEGFPPQTCIERIPVGHLVQRDCLVRLGHPVQAVRIDPLEGVGEFTLSGLRIESVPALVVFARALVGKVALLRKYGSAWQAVGRGCRLLLQGRFRTFFQKLHKGLEGPAFDTPPDYDAQRAYEEWQRRHTLTESELAGLRAAAERLTDAPILSVLLAVSNEDIQIVQAGIESLLRQTWLKWELCIAAASAGAEVRALLEKYARADARIRTFHSQDPVGIFVAMNTAVEHARGAFVIFLRAGDELAEHALQRFARSIMEDSAADMVYSDEDQIDHSGQRVNPFFKPDWSPESLLGQEYVSPLVVRASLVRELGGLRSSCDGATEYDLALRVAARTNRVAHVPDVLYHRRIPAVSQAETPSRSEAIRRALGEHLRETGREGLVEPVATPDAPRVRFRLLGNPRVSILIPTAFAVRKGQGGGRVLVVGCVQSIRALTTWPNYEIIVVADRKVPAQVKATLEQLGVTILPFEQPFNFAATMNRGAQEATGSHLLLLNDDTEVITGDWLESMLEYSQQPDIGAVGARLLFPHGRLQHTGIHLLDGKPLHAFYGYPQDHPGYFASQATPRNYCAVTAACMMTRRDVFHELDGFDPAFALNYNDVDYCLRLLQTGRRIVATPYAQLYHYEASTKRGDDTPELSAFKARWAGIFTRDPYYNSNFSTVFPDYQIDPEAP